MQHDDRVRLQHMLDASREALTFIEGHGRDELDKDRILLLALVKCIEIIGEAASRVSEELRIEAPYIPWRSIIAMRNRLIHAYFDIDPEVIWRTVRDEIPLLIAPLERLLTREP